MINKTKLALGITAALALTGALVSPQAMAHSKKAKHHVVTESSSSYSSSSTGYSNSKVDALEAQLRSMQAEINSLRAQANRPNADAGKVQELDQWMNSVKSEPKESKKSKDNMVFFRGGYGHANNQRGGTLDPTAIPALGLANNNGTTVGPIDDKDSWYFGAGFDFSVNDNLFGLMDKTEVLAELMFDYKQLGERKNNGLSPAETATIAAATGIVLPAANTQKATVNQLTLAASPKIKFMKGSAFRPWLIPVGFELNIVSPPSDAITVLNPGMQFGLGADYKIWNNIYVGADARYHLTTQNTDGVNTDGVTAGGYLGLGF
ncbi:porin family protein [Candidatus Methylobacter oryzae]|uniref:Porin family protein n=1 Tax=Candidatus Methylobacter oryzae TaxID=2497749 RepID=A0ABY3C7I7_9GAMM|nr:porin family protein [Candidatus Methylobacter oryzae]TRW91300.1 porin family protein [Candidatus Methylobacter oryzae]